MGYFNENITAESPQDTMSRALSEQAPLRAAAHERFQLENETMRTKLENMKRNQKAQHGGKITGAKYSGTLKPGENTSGGAMNASVSALDSPRTPSLASRTSPGVGADSIAQTTTAGALTEKTSPGVGKGSLTEQTAAGVGKGSLYDRTSPGVGKNSLTSQLTPGVGDKNSLEGKTTPGAPDDPDSLAFKLKSSSTARIAVEQRARGQRMQSAIAEAGDAYRDAPVVAQAPAPAARPAAAASPSIPQMPMAPRPAPITSAPAIPRPQFDTSSGYDRSLAQTHQLATTPQPSKPTAVVTPPRPTGPPTASITPPKPAPPTYGETAQREGAVGLARRVASNYVSNVSKAVPAIGRVMLQGQMAVNRAVGNAAVNAARAVPEAGRAMVHGQVAAARAGVRGLVGTQGEEVLRNKVAAARARIGRGSAERNPLFAGR